MAKKAMRQSLEESVRQSPLLEFPGVANDSWLKNKVIVITGGASGFGRGFVKRWAAAGAIIIFGDINVAKAMKVVEEVRKETNNNNVHFVECNVTEWLSQVRLFKRAIELSPHGGIDAVVANAGIAEGNGSLEQPVELDAENPPPPNLDIINVNLIGVIYTAHLALYHLPRNPGAAPASSKCDPGETPRDRQLLLLGSLASFIPLPGVALYGTAKHGVLGLYRCLRSTSFVHGVRVNLICPYFIDTPLLKAQTRAMLAGAMVGKTDSVVEAATRFTADSRIVGRAVSVGPRLKVEQDKEGEWTLSEGNQGEDKDIWEIYPHDFEDSDVFQRNMIRVMNRAVELRGWIGWVGDMVGAVSYAVKAYYSKG